MQVLHVPLTGRKSRAKVCLRVSAIGVLADFRISGFRVCCQCVFLLLFFLTNKILFFIDGLVYDPMYDVETESIGPDI